MANEFKIKELLKIAFPVGLPFVYFGDFGLSKSKLLGRQNIIGKEYDNGELSPEWSDFRNLNKVNNKGVQLWKSIDEYSAVFMPTELDGIFLENCIMTINGGKKIIETEIVGKSGTVKELVNYNDFDINLIIIILGDDNIYPEKKVEDILNLYKKNEVITLNNAITSWLLDAKDNCVITKINLPDMQGCQDSQIIEIGLKSDKKFELILE